MITQTVFSSLFIKKEVLYKEDRLELLRQYYENTFPEIIGAAKTLSDSIDRNIPVVAYGYLAHGWRYLELTGRLKNPFYWVELESLELLVRDRGWHQVYTLYRPLNGFNFEKVKIIRGDDETALYKNW